MHRFKKHVPMAQTLSAAKDSDMRTRNFDLIVLGVAELMAQHHERRIRTSTR